jgi:hypothetical protein
VTSATRNALPILTRAELNRATLARQLLLDREGLDPVRAIERIGGLQAQEPASPYLALWSRVAGFDAAALDRAVGRRRAVKATLMRSTLHLVSAADYLHLRPALEPVLRGTPVRDRFRDAGVADIEAADEAALAFAAIPRTNAEIHEHLGSLEPSSGLKGEDIWWRVRRHAAFVHVPAEVPWSFGRRPTFVASRSWLRGRSFADEPAATEHLVRRYLGAFGPATTADIAAWSGLAATRIRAALAKMKGLRRFRDEAGRELVDLARAPRPGGDVHAPPRFLPMWDSVLLAYRDRSRILAEAHRPRVIARNGDVLPTFTVDGEVAGLWWVEPDGSGTRIALEPFGRLGRDVRHALDEEGERLATFYEPLEPGLYTRYRGSRARR